MKNKGDFMKKLILLCGLSLLFSGCSNRTILENKSNRALQQGENSSAKSSTDTNNNASSNSSAKSLNGEKIEIPVEIKFEPDGLPKGWQWIDADKGFPSGYETKNGTFSLKIPSGKDLFGGTMTAPQLLKAVAGDFEIETRVKFDPKNSYQGAGLLIFKDDDNYLRLERGFGGIGGGASGIRLDRRNNQGYDAIATPEKIPTEATEVELKFVRKGKNFQAFWRENEDGEWKLVGEYASDYPETVKIGLIGVNTAEEITAEFAYIKLVPIAK